MSVNDFEPTFTFPEITDAPPGGYHHDKRFKLGEAGEKFIQRHVTQARELVASFSNPPTTVDSRQYGVFKHGKFAQWKSNGLAADADTQAKFERKWNNIHHQIVSQSRSNTVAGSTPAEAGLIPPLHLASTVDGITTRSIFNEEHSEAHKAAVRCDRKQHVGHLAALRAAERYSLTPAQQAQYQAKAEVERQRIYGDLSDDALEHIEKVLTAAVGTNPGQVGRAAFAFQFMFNTKDGKRKCGGVGFGECDHFAGTPGFGNTLVPIFKQFANDHTIPYEAEAVSDRLSAIPWADIYRSPTSFFVDPVIPVGSSSMARIENMKWSSMFKLADRIQLVQQSDRPNVLRAKADILRILRSPPSEVVAPKIPNTGVTIIDVDAIPSSPSRPQFDSSGELPSIPQVSFGVGQDIDHTPTCR
ncbi:hypothetical protein BDN71DRAFT_1430336 [Pleurotus eryngii]|uniref:Uncharacterized protein n=1 Tax=Pleurotus eryngii TaxID=5323 RepID=A0A9P5ZXP9_PLEER|nr:hypothetical protein BDN71DRAFT_1430336 [Pleurotus eryngii]